MTRRAVTVVGIGADGCASLTSRAIDAVVGADVLVGGKRQLEFFPQWKGERIVLGSDVAAAVESVRVLSDERDVVVLASGDPLFFGIGKRLVDAVGREHVEVVPAPSSLQWACARVGIASEDVEVFSAHGREMRGLAVALRHAEKLACLTDAKSSPDALARHLLAYGVTHVDAWVCEDLAGPGERVRRFTLEDLAEASGFASLSIVVFVKRPDAPRARVVAFADEEAFERRMPKKGLITKREVRLLSIAALGLSPTSIVWDVGAASGSIAIESALLARKGRVYAIERDAECIPHCEANARAFGADNVVVVHGEAPHALAGLEAPDAVFVGGSRGAMEEILEASLAALRPEGRLVVNAITMENVHEAYAFFRARGLVPELLLAQVSRGIPLARYVRYEAQNPIHVFAVTKPAVERVAS